MNNHFCKLAIATSINSSPLLPVLFITKAPTRCGYWNSRRRQRNTFIQRLWVFRIYVCDNELPAGFQAKISLVPSKVMLQVHAFPIRIIRNADSYKDASKRLFRRWFLPEPKTRPALTDSGLSGTTLLQANEITIPWQRYQRATTDECLAANFLSQWKLLFKRIIPANHSIKLDSQSFLTVNSIRCYGKPVWLDRS